MVRKGLLMRASPLPPSLTDGNGDESFDDLEASIEKSKPHKRRRVQHGADAKGSGTLRALLGLTAADDYIETLGSLATKSATSNHDEDCESKPKGYQIASQIRSSDDDSDDSDDDDDDDDEPVLPLSRVPREHTAPAPLPQQTPAIEVQKIIASHHERQSLSTSHAEDDEVEQALSLSAPGHESLLAGFIPRSGPVNESSDTSADEEELALSVKAPPSAAGLDQNKSKVVIDSMATDGQRPAFPVPPDLRDVGPLNLAAGVQVLSAINRFLRSYQRDGVRFLYRSYVEGRGALLGDDMGLGKTIQVIAFLSAIMGKSGREQDADRRIEAERSDRQSSGYQRANAVWPTCLIICPSSVIDNWRHELDTWGYFEHAAYSGTRAKDALDAFRRGRLDILVTSHETASLSIEHLRDLDLSCVLIDEAHKLKNPSSQMTQSMQTFRCKARFALTGTAIQNTYRELYTLADWTNPGLLGSVKEWIKEIEIPLKHGQKRGADPEHIADARTRAEKLVKNVLPIFFLRRTKALIADQLPQKYDKIVFCPLISTQLDVYRRILNEEEVVPMKRHADPCDCGRIDPETGLAYRRQNCCYKRDSKGHTWNKNMLKYIYLLQKCSNHVALVFPDPEDATSGEPDREERYQRQLSYVQLMFPNSWQGKRCNAANGMEPEFCGKWKVLARLLKQWHTDGDKVLLFSTNLRLLQFIEFFLAREGHNFLRLDGSTPQPRRQLLVNQFNRDASNFVFLISTTAGGTGLNLTAANRVVVFDPHWNPSHDLQAMDRAYRFGQSRDVYVYRLIGAGSLEEVVYGRQLYKQQQMEIGYNATKERRYFEGVAGDQGSLGELFGCKNLFTLHESSLAMKSVIDECNISEVTFALEQYLKSGPLEGQETVDAVMAELAQSQGASQLESQTQIERQATAQPTATGGKDPIRSILEGSGISYSHDHAALVGDSAAEAALYRKAAQQEPFRQQRVTSHRNATGKVKTPANPSSSSKSRAYKVAAAPIWPPPRSKSAAPAPQAQATNDETQSLDAATQGLRQAVGHNPPTRTPDLSDLAQLQNMTEVEVAAAVNAMPATEQRAFFDDAIRRWNRKQAVRQHKEQQKQLF